MARSDAVWEEHYKPFLNGGDRHSFAYSPERDRGALLHSMYMRQLIELSVNRFKWFGLPDSVDERFLELTLLFQGGILFFEHERNLTGDDNNPLIDARFLVQPFANSAQINYYNNPTSFRIVSVGGIQGNYTSKEAVPIWGNYMRTPDIDVVAVYAHRLAELDKTIDVTTINLRKPRVLVMSEQTRLTMENIDRSVQEGVPVLKLSSSDPIQNYASLDLGGSHEAVPSLLASKGKLWNEALTMLGVPAINQDKKERMITDETDSAKDQSVVIRQIALNSRQDACDKINKLFGLNMWCEWRASEDEDTDSTANLPQLFANDEDDD